MKLMNPHYSNQESAAEQEVSSYQTQVESWLTNNTDKASVTFDQIRAYFNKTATEWPDGVIHSRLTKWGYQVES